MDRAGSRLRVLALLVAVMFIALSARLWFLQVLATDKAKKEARNQSVRFVYSEPLRGNILDANGEKLVGNRMSLQIRVNRDELGDRRGRVLNNLSELLEVPVGKIAAKLDDDRYYSYQPIPIADFVPERVAYYIGEHPERFQGVDVVQTSVRDYPLHRLAAHVLGYVGLINAAEYDALKNHGYGQSDTIGKTGLEDAYERYLRGSKGVQKVVVNSDGEVIRTFAAQPAKAGDNLELSLDAKVQRIAEHELLAGITRAHDIFDDPTGKNLRANAGAVVVLDPSTGGVVAMASWPTYDPTWYVKGLTHQEAQYLFHSPPLVAPSNNRAVQLDYTPGSTFKPFVALSAVKEGLASLSGYYPCPGEYAAPTDPDHVFHNWTTGSLGSLSIAETLKISCDTVFYPWGFEFWDQWRQNQLSNKEPFQQDLREFGFGAPTGIDLPSESDGLVPDAAYVLANPDAFPDGMVPGVDILTSIGSTYVFTTPLQLATAYAALANGGELCRPHLVQAIVDPGGRTVKNVGTQCTKLPYGQAQLDYIRNALATVPTGGTAASAFAGFPFWKVTVAGKTGTAERPPFQDTSWFAAMVPATDPKYVIVAMVEQGGHGSTTAAPIVRRIIERLYGIPRPSGPISGGAQD